MGEKTVRELGGEIWAELQEERHNPHSPLPRFGVEEADALIDFLMSILVRHTGATIINDPGLPVFARPLTNRGK